MSAFALLGVIAMAKSNKAKVVAFIHDFTGCTKGGQLTFKRGENQTTVQYWPAEDVADMPGLDSAQRKACKAEDIPAIRKAFEGAVLVVGFDGIRIENA